MEKLNIVLNNPDAYKQVLDNGLPECGDLTIITLDFATIGNNAGALIAFTVMPPEGETELVQAAVTVANLIALARILQGRYNDDGSLRFDILDVDEIG